MQLIDADIYVTVRLYDDEHEEYRDERMTIAECLDRFTDELQAQQLVGYHAYMLKSDISEENEILPTWQSLKGYRVLDTDQGELGIITDVDETTINTLITLNNNQLIPLHEDFIIDILQEQQQITICLPFIFTKE